MAAKLFIGVVKPNRKGGDWFHVVLWVTIDAKNQ